MKEIIFNCGFLELKKIDCNLLSLSQVIVYTNKQNRSSKKKVFKKLCFSGGKKCIRTLDLSFLLNQPKVKRLENSAKSRDLFQ